ncbi:MAG: iron-sulfur cluster assembly scaffold protein [Gemmatimonadetes bacterium]|jgi:nitrogen fixation protein NifU and related proteins|nr:iron-sulfur cluster assembly scaffold protein [Gemmatimonadota bacterium]
MALYNEKVLDHFENPRNVGELEGANAVGIAENSACGDVLHLYMEIEEERVVRATFKTFGCTAAIAAGSMLTEMLIGADLEEIRDIRKEDVVEALGGLPPMKLHCSVLAEDAIRAALGNYKSI